MLGGKNKRPHGYTIVEVMLFLAISGVMFLMAILFINGKQASAQFTQTVNDFNTQLQRMISDVGNGEYSSLGTLSCVANGLGGITLATSGGSGQGSNSDCVFLGKVLAGDGLHYELVSVAGLRLDGATKQPIIDPLAASPTALADGTGGALDSLVDKRVTPGSISISASKVDLPAGGSITGTGVLGFAFLASPSDQSGAGFSNQSVRPYYISGLTSASATNLGQLVTAIHTNMHPAKALYLCFSDGNRKATISVGVNGNQFTSVLDRTGNITCS
ncbi:MAG TPA: hypothetical protein VLG13_03400 [Patescibacteria group bacterium]|nr:hypothetical protein [Patescibacteria group bacterium]